MKWVVSKWPNYRKRVGRKLERWAGIAFLQGSAGATWTCLFSVALRDNYACGRYGFFGLIRITCKM